LTPSPAANLSGWWLAIITPDTLGLPLIVKPPREGSSIGITKVAGYSQMQGAVELAAKYDADVLCEEFVEGERQAGRFQLKLAPMPGKTALLHGHCHQKAFGTAAAAVAALQMIPELKVETFDSTCCGMAGAFGYEAEHHEMSLKIGELGVLPKMRAAAPDTLLAACGTSCRHQIADGARREARHIVRILDEASAPPP